ncbi:MAG: insulinase family protein [Gemmatimonadetes bacterium]|nr:insulinase family protein [Gemmatimonadota bacterium]
MRYMLRVTATVNAVLAAVLAQAIGAQQLDLAERLPVDSQVRINTLENGLRYYVRANQRPENRAELRLVVNVGSVLEDDDQLGLAHFAEHMAFNGTESFEKQAIIDYLETVGMRFGADINASTSFDETIYRLTVPTDDAEILDTGFRILEEWAHKVTFDREEVELERGVVIEEWRRGRGADARMRDEQFPTLFANSRYADRLPIGTIESLENFEYERLTGFYERWYRPDLMAVIAIGDFDPDAIETLIRDRFGGIPLISGATPRPVFDVPPHAETLFALASDPEAATSMVSVYHKQPLREQGSVGSYRQSIVEQLYNSMFNDRLAELTHTSDPPFIFGFSSQGQLVRSGEVYFLAALVAGGAIETGLRALLVEAERVERHGFVESELERAKAEALRGMEQFFADRGTRESRSFAAEYRRNYLTDEPIPGIEVELELYRTFLPTITLSDVNSLAEQWLTDQSRVILSNSPINDEIEQPTESGLQLVLESIDDVPIEPYEDTVTEAPLIANAPAGSEVIEESAYPSLGVVIWELANGVRVLLKSTDFEDDEVVFRAFSPGGTSLASDEDFIAARTASSVVSQGGVGDFNLINLQKALAGKAVRVSPSIATFTEGLAGSASPEDIETMFQLIYLYFTQPRSDSVAFQSFRSRMSAFFANRGADPEAVFSDTVSVTLSQGHLRARPITPEFFEGMDLETSYEFYRDRFADAGDFTFIIVGKFEPDSIRSLVETYLGGLPSTGRQESWQDVGIEAPSGVIRKRVVAGIEPKSRTEIVFTGELSPTRHNRYILSSTAAVLEIMLRERLREDLGGTYHVGVSAEVEREPDHGYSFHITFGSDPERTDELIAVVFEQIASLATAGPSDSNLVKVQQAQRLSYETSLRRNDFWVSNLVRAERYGTDPEMILRLEELIDGLTKERIRRAADEYLSMDNYVLVSLFPESRSP